jgi:hypothetical protein
MPFPTPRNCEEGPNTLPGDFFVFVDELAEPCLEYILKALAAVSVVPRGLAMIRQSAQTHSYH